MKRVLLVLMLVCPAWASYTVTDTCSGTTSCSLTGSHNPGDLIFYWSYRAGSATAPSKPAALTNVTNGSSATGANRSWRAACSVAQTTGTIASGTFTNATNMGAVAISGTGATSTANCATDAVGTVGTANNVSSATATFSALTMSGGSSSIGLLLMGSSTSGQTCMPASGTSKTSTGDINIGIANATGNWASDTCTITSSVTTEIVVEIKALATLATCSSNCPTWVQYKQEGSTSNNGTPLPKNAYFHLHNVVGTSNLLAAAFRWFDATNTITATVTADGTSMTAGPACHDASGTNIGIWYLANAGGKQNVKIAMSSAVGSLGAMFVELRGVPTSSPTDGSNCTAGTTGPLAQSGSITTTADNDLLWVAGFDNGDNVVLNATNLYSAPVDNWNLLGANNSIGPVSYYTVWGSHGAVNPGILAYQGTNDVWAVAALAFKQSAGTGTALTGMYIARDVNTIPTATSFKNQFPAAGNLEVVVTDTDNAQSSLNSMADSDSNTWTRKLGGTGFPQFGFAGNATITKNNTRTVTIGLANTNTNPFHLYDIVGAATSPLDTSSTSSDGTASAGVVTRSGTQTAVGPSSTTCTSNANSDSTMHITPSTSSGIVIIGEWNGSGPECGMNGTNNNFTSVWFEGENDTCCGNLESSSGNGHIAYSSAAAQTITFNWANTGSASPSGWGIMALAFEAPASTGVPGQFPRVQ